MGFDQRQRNKAGRKRGIRTRWTFFIAKAWINERAKEGCPFKKGGRADSRSLMLSSRARREPRDAAVFRGGKGDAGRARCIAALNSDRDQSGSEGKRTMRRSIPLKRAALFLRDAISRRIHHTRAICGRDLPLKDSLGRTESLCGNQKSLKGTDDQSLRGWFRDFLLSGDRNVRLRTAAKASFYGAMVEAREMQRAIT